MLDLIADGGEGLEEVAGVECLAGVGSGDFAKEIKLFAKGKCGRNNRGEGDGSDALLVVVFDKGGAGFGEALPVDPLGVISIKKGAQFGKVIPLSE